MKNMPCEKSLANLKPSVKGTEEARERASKGGRVSGEKRRERRALKEELLLLLENGDTQQKICLELIQKALQGDIKAFEVIRDTTGQKPKEELSLIAEDKINIKIDGN